MTLTRTSRELTSLTHPADGVTESVVRVKVPLPSSFGARPAACDWLSYLRYRSAGGPEASVDADRRWATITEAVDRLTAAGATARQEFPGHHVVMADPEGNEFCVC